MFRGVSVTANIVKLVFRSATSALIYGGFNKLSVFKAWGSSRFRMLWSNIISIYFSPEWNKPGALGFGHTNHCLPESSQISFMETTKAEKYAIFLHCPPSSRQKWWKLANVFKASRSQAEQNAWSDGLRRLMSQWPVFSGFFFALHKVSGLLSSSLENLRFVEVNLGHVALISHAGYSDNCDNSCASCLCSYPFDNLPKAKVCFIRVLCRNVLTIDVSCGIRIVRSVLKLQSSCSC